MTSHDVMCSSELVLCNNVIIFVLFDKTAKLLVFIMIWVKETKDSVILVTSLHTAQSQNVVLSDYGMGFGINTGIWLVSVVYLSTLIMTKSVTENVIPDVLGRGSSAIIE